MDSRATRASRLLHARVPPRSVCANYRSRGSARRCSACPFSRPSAQPPIIAQPCCIHPWSPALRTLDALLPIGVIGPLVAAFALAALTKSYPRFSLENQFPLLATFTFAAIPPVLLYAAFLLTDVNPFVPRYYLATSLPIALLAAWAIHAIGPRPVRNFALGSLVAFSLLTQGVVVRSHARQDWRGAMAQVRAITAPRPDLPVLLISGFQESNTPEYLESPIRRQMVFAVSHLYPGGGREFYLPMTFGPLAGHQIDQAAPAIEQSREFLLITLNRAAYEPYLLGRFSTLGLRVRQSYAFESVTLTWYEASRSASSASVAQNQPEVPKAAKIRAPARPES